MGYFKTKRRKQETAEGVRGLADKSVLILEKRRSAVPENRFFGQGRG